MLEKIELNKFWVLKDEQGEPSSLIRFFESTPEDISYISFYLFGGEDMLGEKHDFKTPKELLINYIKENCSTDELISIAKSTVFPEYKFDSINKEYVVNLDSKGKMVRVIGKTIIELILNVLPELTCKNLALILRTRTKYEAVNLYCEEGDPNYLYVNKASMGMRLMQVGYAIVDNEYMFDETMYDTAKSAVEQAIEFLNPEEKLYSYEIYFNECTPGNVEPVWSLFEENGEYEGEDIVDNGLLLDIGEEWLEAEEYELTAKEKALFFT